MTYAILYVIDAVYDPGSLTAHQPGDPGAPVTAPRGTDGRIVVVDQLTKRFGGEVLAVDRLSFTVEPQLRITGFLGPNGAGKTTTLRMVLGLVHPTSGQATIGGMPYRRLPFPSRMVRRGARVGEFPSGAHRPQPPARAVHRCRPAALARR